MARHINNKRLKKTIHALFFGLVQGVGFRFTARHLANKYKIRGWVKNLSDGSVEILISGDSASTNEFFINLQEIFKHSIQDYTKEELPYDDKETEFKIKF